MKQYISNNTVQFGGINPGSKKALFYNITMSFVEPGSISLCFCVARVENEDKKYFMEVDNTCYEITFSDLTDSKYILPSAEIKESDMESFKTAIFTKYMNEKSPYGLTFSGVTELVENW